MILYNVTVKIGHDLVDDWLDWMRSTHIPAVTNTGLFSGYRLLRIMNDEEDDGLTYAVQYTCPSRSNFDAYLRSHAAELQEKHRQRYGNEFVAIRTLMQVVEERVMFASES